MRSGFDRLLYTIVTKISYTFTTERYIYSVKETRMSEKHRSITKQTINPLSLSTEYANSVEITNGPKNEVILRLFLEHVQFPEKLEYLVGQETGERTEKEKSEHQILVRKLVTQVAMTPEFADQLGKTLQKAAEMFKAKDEKEKMDDKDDVSAT